jgi:hypothetical protein
MGLFRAGSESASYSTELLSFWLTNREFLADTVKKKLGFLLTSLKPNRYRIETRRVADMAKSAIDVGGALARVSALTIFELRGEWRRARNRIPVEIGRQRQSPTFVPRPAGYGLCHGLPRTDAGGQPFILNTGGALGSLPHEAPHIAISDRLVQPSFASTLGSPASRAPITRNISIIG